MALRLRILSNSLPLLSPNDFLEDDNEAYACVVLVTDTEEKYTGTVGHLVAKLVSDETSEYASLVLASSSDNWHYYFQLAEGSYESVTSIVATAIIEGAHIVKTIEDPQSYEQYLQSVHIELIIQESHDKGCYSTLVHR